MNKQFPFEKLEIWQLSIDLSVAIYNATRNFPAEEKFGVTNQIRRAVNSVSANIAEGSSRFSKKDKARFYQIAFGSIMEVLNFLILSEKLGYMDNGSLLILRAELEKLSNKINAYYSKLIE